MEIKHYLSVLSRRKWIILVTFAAVVATVIIGTRLMTPIYTATATLRVSLAPNGTIDYSELTYADRLINTYAKLALSEPIQKKLADETGLHPLPSIQVAAVPDTELIQITVDSSSPQLSSNVANSLAALLVENSRTFYAGPGTNEQDLLNQQLTQVNSRLTQARQDRDRLAASSPGSTTQINSIDQSIAADQTLYDSLQQQIQQAQIRNAMQENAMSTAEPAVPPLVPTRPKPLLYLALGALLGLVGGIGLAFLFENLDSTLYSPNQIEAASGLSSLANIPVSKLKMDTPLVLNGNSPAGEAIRQLRVRLLQPKGRAKIHTLLVTSAQPGEGKSTLVASLAYAMAKPGTKVIVVDADMRLPSLDKVFKVPNELGLSNILAEEAEPETVIQSTSTPGVFIIPSGPIPSNPADLLSSKSMTALIKYLRGQYEFILIDAPAVLAASDATILATLTDGVVLVVASSQTRKEWVQAACKQLSDSNPRLIGVVTNRAKNVWDPAYYPPSPDR
jgi:non-specific protein-tyrosine kinase